MAVMIVNDGIEKFSCNIITISFRGLSSLSFCVSGHN